MKPLYSRHLIRDGYLSTEIEAKIESCIQQGLLPIEWAKLDTPLGGCTMWQLTAYTGEVRTISDDWAYTLLANTKWPLRYQSAYLFEAATPTPLEETT